MSQTLAASVAALRAETWLQLAEVSVTPRQAMCLKGRGLETATRHLASAKTMLQAGSAPRLRWHLHETAAGQVGMEWTRVTEASRSEFSPFVISGKMSVPQKAAANLPSWSYFADRNAISRDTSPATRAAIDEAKLQAGVLSTA